MTGANFSRLYEELMRKDFVAAAHSPLGHRPQTPDVKKKIESGRPFLPTAFLKGYVDPLSKQLEEVVAKLNEGKGPGPANVETVAGAIYQHTETDLQPRLRRFLAVVSDLYRSFLDADKRSSLNIALIETIPPLAVFQSDPTKGPFTLKCDEMRALTQGNIGVVSLPHTFANEPLFYGCLAHETGGHDVIHADPRLLQEMCDEAHSLFDGAELPWLGLLWDYWMDEASADVFGVLNVGPSLGLSTALLLSVFVPKLESKNPKQPALRHVSEVISDGNLDEHPTDILRLAVIEGAVGALRDLSPAIRQSYSRQLSELGEALVPKAAKIKLAGTAHAKSNRARIHKKKFNDTVPLARMQAAARLVGAMIATHPFAALDGHSIQDIETWDDTDEKAAVRIADRLQAGLPVVGLGDDARIVAGLTLAVLREPGGYKAASTLADHALDHSFAMDPYWRHASGP